MTGIKPHIITEMLETRRIIDAHPLEMLAALYDLRVYRTPKMVVKGRNRMSTKSLNN